METAFSPGYNRRDELMETLEIPTISEAREELGEPLAQIFFEQCPESLQPDLGLKPPLKGAGNELWTSPSDLLIGKVCLKPPLTQKHIQALTHQGILKIGAEIEIKYWKEMESAKSKELTKQETILKRICDFQKLRLTEQIRKEEYEKYWERLAAASKHFEQQKDRLLFVLETEMQEQENRFHSERKEIQTTWDSKLAQEVERTVVKLTKEFLQKLKLQEGILVKIFMKQIKIIENKRRYAVDFEKIKCKESLLQIKHNLECKNIANLMYMLCNERRKCTEEKEKLESEYLKEIEDLKKTVENQRANLESLTGDHDTKTRKLNVRERCLLAILGQFQKFIYYALKATPTQAEFLLDINRLLTFELENYCLNDSEEYASKPEENYDSIEGATSKVCLETKLDLGEEQVVTGQNQIRGNGDQQDVLPAFYYNNKLYIREDFRDMLVLGKGLSQRSSLWNKDVEELMNVFKSAVQQEKSINRLSPASSRRSHQSSSVHFSNSGIAIVPQESPSRTQSSFLMKSDIDSVSRQCPAKGGAPPIIKRSSYDDPAPISTRQPRKSILGATDSLILAKAGLPDEIEISSSTHSPARSRRSSIRSETGDLPEDSLKNRNKSGSKLVLARNSIILQIASMERKSIVSTSQGIPADMGSIRDPDISSQGNLLDENRVPLMKTSKLALHRDSLEIVKDSSKAQIDVDEVTPSGVVHAGSGRKSIVTFDAKMFKGLRPKLSLTGKSPSKTGRAKVKPKAKVVGSKQSKEHEKEPEQFTAERINSLVNLMKDNPSLIRLFTSVIR